MLVNSVCALSQVVLFPCFTDKGFYDNRGERWLPYKHEGALTPTISRNNSGMFVGSTLGYVYRVDRVADIGVDPVRWARHVLTANVSDQVLVLPS